MLAHDIHRKGVRGWQLPVLGLVSLGLSAAAHFFAGNGPLMNSPVAAMVAWLVAIVLAVVSCSRGRTAVAETPTEPRWSRLEIAGVVGLGLFALLIRVVSNADIPGALTGDEGMTGLPVVAILEHQLDNPFILAGFSFPSLFFFILAPFVAMLGRTFAALRTPAALAGALTVVGLYWLGRTMFGRAVAGLSAALFAAQSYHIHFSRLGLNNIWDGLTTVLLLASFWRGWQTGRRHYFVLAGLVLGISQYFYVSARLLAIVLALWVVLALATDWRYGRERIRDLLALGLVALVVFLPLALMYVEVPASFSARTIQVSLLTKRWSDESENWFEMTSRTTGVPIGLVVLDNARKAALGFTSRPLQEYFTGQPVLLPLPAILFTLGLGLALIRLRDKRFWLLLLPLAGVVGIVTLTGFEPVGQRYIIGAPIAALLAGLGLASVARRIARSWPKLRATSYGVACGIMALAMALDLNFYFYSYAPTRGWSDANTQVVSKLARHLQSYPPGSQIFFFGRPAFSEVREFPVIAYLITNVRGTGVVDKLSAPPDWKLSGPRTAFAFLPERQDEAALVERRYPGGTYEWFYDTEAKQLFLLYEVGAFTPA